MQTSWKPRDPTSYLQSGYLVCRTGTEKIVWKVLRPSRIGEGSKFAAMAALIVWLSGIAIAVPWHDAVESAA
jgi:hypothetical protein